ncbi:MAG: pro-sigmaK processing inhibitor BofA family protein [Candidatus Marsarchaeota archaeon]|jgi:SigmaK-factor processing regulatory protein BofA.|nr:pro-sigmaK processing inhibitor BofA family protein [Candidatus Marsarchaeota archaeon]
MVLTLGSGILSEIPLIVGAFVVLYIIFKLGKLVAGLIVNTVLGFISIYVLNSLFAFGIPWNWVVIIITAILGLPGVAIIILLKFLGISILGMPV